jgi:RHS repeat-associated protein
VLFQVNGSGQAVAIERNHYYATGLKIAGLSGETAGEEWREGYADGVRIARQLSLTWQEHGVRHYDPTLGRWNQYEPLADRFATMSPYVYANNDPMNSTDPTGYSAWSDRAKVMRDGMGDHYYGELMRRVGGGGGGQWGSNSSFRRFGTQDFQGGDPGLRFTSVQQMIDYVWTNNVNLVNAGNGAFYAFSGTNEYEAAKRGDKEGTKIKSSNIKVTGSGSRAVFVNDLIGTYLSNGLFESQGLALKFSLAIAIYKLQNFNMALTVVEAMNHSEGGYSVEQSDVEVGEGASIKAASRQIRWNPDYESTYRWDDGENEHTYTSSALGVLAHELGHFAFFARYGKRDIEASQDLAIEFEVAYASLIGIKIENPRPASNPGLLAEIIRTKTYFIWQNR